MSRIGETNAAGESAEAARIGRKVSADRAAVIASGEGGRGEVVASPDAHLKLWLQLLRLQLLGLQLLRLQLLRLQLLRLQLLGLQLLLLECRLATDGSVQTAWHGASVLNPETIKNINSQAYLPLHFYECCLS